MSKILTRITLNIFKTISPQINNPSLGFISKLFNFTLNQTRLTITQDNNGTEKMKEESETIWNMTLKNLKRTTRKVNSI